MLTPPRRRFVRSQAPDDSPIPLTPEAHQRMKERLLRIKASLPALIEETQRTAAYGDRSDSAEYKEAKGQLRKAHRQIFSIEDQLKRVEVIDTSKNNSGIVQLGSTVVLDLVAGGIGNKNNSSQRKTFTILGSYETDPGKGRISNKSPLGAAIMDKTKGDVVTIQTPNGSQEYRIVEIR